jgi:hypothetical protein
MPHKKFVWGFSNQRFHFSFGRNVPGKTDPMDGVEGIAEKVSFNYKFSNQYDMSIKNI